MFLFRLFIILILLILFTASVYAQGDYLEKGENALEFGGLASVNDSEKKPGGSFGLSIRRIVDIGLSFQKIRIQKTLFTKSMAVHISRQDSYLIPFGVSFKASTSSYNVGNLFTENNYSYGPVIYRNISIGNTLTIQPSIGLSWLGEHSIDKNSINKHGLGYDLGLSSYLKIGSGDVINLSLRYSFYNSDYVGESGKSDDVEVQATYIMRNFGGKKINFRERQKAYSIDINEEIGFGLLFMADNNGSIMGGVSFGIRAPQILEFNLSGVSYEGLPFGISGDIAFYAVKGGTKYKRPGIALLGGLGGAGGLGFFSIGAGLYGDYFVSKRTMIQPLLAVAYIDSPGHGRNRVGSQFSLSIYREIKKGQKLKLDIAFVMADIGSGFARNNIGFGVGIGIMFGGKSAN